MQTCESTAIHCGDDWVLTPSVYLVRFRRLHYDMPSHFNRITFALIGTALACCAAIGVASVRGTRTVDHDIAFSLDKAVIAPGDTFTLTTTFHNDWAAFTQLNGQVRITDQSGTEWLVLAGSGAR